MFARCTVTGLCLVLLCCAVTIECCCRSCTVVSRSVWNARAPKSNSTLKTPVSLVFIHHTDTPTCSSRSQCVSRLRSIQYDHMYQKSLYDISYNFLVSSAGDVYEGRGWDTQGAHTERYNDRSIAIAFIGNFQSASPTKAALEAAQNVIKCGIMGRKIDLSYKLYGHCQSRYTGTNCPGSKLFSIIQGWSNFETGRAPE